MEQKKLTELSLDELWQLFPITLTAHQDYWADWYKEEAELLKERLPCIGRGLSEQKKNVFLHQNISQTRSVGC